MNCCYFLILFCSSIKMCGPEVLPQELFYIKHFYPTLSKHIPTSRKKDDDINIQHWFLWFSLLIPPSHPSLHILEGSVILRSSCGFLWAAAPEGKAREKTPGSFSTSLEIPLQQGQSNPGGPAVSQLNRNSCLLINFLSTFMANTECFLYLLEKSLWSCSIAHMNSVSTLWGQDPMLSGL